MADKKRKEAIEAEKARRIAEKAENDAAKMKEADLAATAPKAERVDNTVDLIAEGVVEVPEGTEAEAAEKAPKADQAETVETEGANEAPETKTEEEPTDPRDVRIAALEEQVSDLLDRCGTLDELTEKFCNLSHQVRASEARMSAASMSAASLNDQKVEGLIAKVEKAVAEGREKFEKKVFTNVRAETIEAIDGLVKGRFARYDGQVAGFDQSLKAIKNRLERGEEEANSLRALVEGQLATTCEWVLGFSKSGAYNFVTALFEDTKAKAKAKKEAKEAVATNEAAQTEEKSEVAPEPNPTPTETSVENENEAKAARREALLAQLADLDNNETEE